MNFGQNELWVCPVASKLFQRRPLTFFQWAAHKKLKKRVLFAFWPITPMQKFLRGIQGMPTESWRPGLSENVVVFVAIIFKPELWLLKVNGIWNFGNVSKNKKPFGKITRLQFCVFCSAIESASKHTYWANADSIWKLETQNCSRVIFPNGLTFQLFFFEFWPNFD